MSYPLWKEGLEPLPDPFPMGSLPEDPAAPRALREFRLGLINIGRHPPAGFFSGQDCQGFVTFNATGEKMIRDRKFKFPYELPELFG